LRSTIRAALAALLGLALLAPATASAASSSSRLEAYSVRATADNLDTLARGGFDMTEARVGGTVEIAATHGQVRALKKQGVNATLKRNEEGLTALQFDAQAQRPDGSYDVYRPYWDRTYVGEDDQGDPRMTLYQELQALAAAHPTIVRPVIIGRSLNDKPILALKITKNARTTPDGSRPAVLYSSNQHAREWITPEMNRRLAHLFVENYTTQDDDTRPTDEDGDPLSEAAGDVTRGDITKLVDENELWIIVSANPDGYDFTFTPGHRLWRKNLRDNDGDGQLTTNDGVDPNRNFATNWNYDNEGSNGNFDSETYRGTGPNSEPETQAMDGLLDNVRFKMQINYHSAAELLLYPTGFQVETLTEDDPIYVALSGTDEDSAVKGVEPGAPNDYDPDVGAELYTTNGETTDHAHKTYGTLAWTPEMDVADADRGAVGEEGAPPSVFEFQDSDADLEQAFEKNIPFALDVAKSAKDPDDPVSHLGNHPAPFVVDAFGVSYGDPQVVSANVQRQLGPVTMLYSINGGPTQSSSTTEWQGGERFGGDYDVYYHRVRGTVQGTNPGDSVEVWFEAGGKSSDPFTYQAEEESDDPVLILVGEDYSGHSPDYADPTKPAYLGYYTRALDDLGVGYDIYDPDAHDRTAPDTLGVLSHYAVVIWYTGDDRRTIEPDQPPTGTGASKLADDMYRAVRGYMNEGGKLLFTGEQAGHNMVQQFVFNVNGGPPYCGQEGGPPISDNLTPCIPMSNDFLQYYLGVGQANTLVDDDKAAMDANTASFGPSPFGPLTVGFNGPQSADNQNYAYTLTPTNTLPGMSPEEYPMFNSEGVGKFALKGPLQPPTGDWYVYSGQADVSYKRLTRTIDLTGATDGDLSFAITRDTEADWDYVFVEAHTVGQDDWTTLPDENGHTSESTGPDDAGSASCPAGWHELHPWLERYQTFDGTGACTPTGTTGEWNAATGASDGPERWSIDLSDYAGEQVEVSISYASDWFTQGLGVFIDDTAISTGESTSFEEDMGGWAVPGPPEGSDPNANDWHRSQAIFEEDAGVRTGDSVYFGFGLEGISNDADREDLLSRSLRWLGINPAGKPTPGQPGGPVGGGGPPAGEKVVRVKKKPLRVNGKRRFWVRFKCPASAGDRCEGLLTVLAGRDVLGRREFSIPADEFSSVRLRMSHEAYRDIKKKGPRDARILVVTRGADGELRREEALRKVRRKHR